jgi:ATP-binding cassette, subfamily F, member 3
MSLVSGTGLAVSYGAHDVFADVTFDLPHRARIALIGPNGSGKTSLLRVVAGLDRPGAGSLARARDLTIGYLPQVPHLESRRTLYREMRAAFEALDRRAVELERLAAAMADASGREDATDRYARLEAEFEADGGYEIDQRIDRVLTGLGFTAADYDRPLGRLSGGQQTRALLGRLLLESPGLLLLDEPTNHLDLNAVEWLEAYLRDWSGAVLFVAHDRAFLDNVADRVWELAGGQLVQYPGNYSHYAAVRAERVAVAERQYARQQADIARTEDFIRRNIANQSYRQAQSRQKALARMERAAVPRDLDSAARVRLDAGRRSGDRVLRFKNLAIGYDPGRPLFTCDELELYWRDKVALLGPNGAGKTTLLRTIMGELAPLAGELRLGGGVRPGYFSQSHERLVGDRTVLEHVCDASGMLVAEARGFLGRYRFSGDDVFKPVQMLSGGERARVALALLELDGANLLVLDEPTNHLDVHSQEMLQAVLAEFAGTVLLVSHDRFLIRALGGHVWAIHDRRLQHFVDGYDAYRAWLSAHEAAGDDGERAARAAAWRADRKLVREAERSERRRAARQEALEDEIAALESRLATLHAQLEQASRQQKVASIARLGDDYAAAQSELDARLAEWLTLTEEDHDEDADGRGPTAPGRPPSG